MPWYYNTTTAWDEKLVAAYVSAHFFLVFPQAIVVSVSPERTEQDTNVLAIPPPPFSTAANN